jgi:replicative DNA helicase
MKDHLPSDPDLERMVLGYCLMRSARFDEARGSLDVDDFSLEKHQRLWRRMCGLYDAGSPVDHVTVFKELQAHCEAESVGGLSYIVDLEEGLPENPHIDGYITRLRECALRRRMIFTAERLMAQASDESGSVDDVLSGFSDAVVSLSQSTGNSNRPISTTEMLEQKGISGILCTRREHGVRLPWTRLDKALSGMSAGQMIVLMAATSRGKTSMALQAATYAALQGVVPCVWGMEMNALSNYQRIVTQLSGAPVGSYSLTYEQRTAQGEACVKVGENPLYFDSHSRSVGSFMATLRQIRSRAKLGLAVVDHLQLIRPGASRNRAQEVSDNSRALKLAAMDMGIPFLVLSQVDRSSVKGDGKIGLHSGKESGDIENDADVVLWIEAGELSKEQDTAVAIHVGKQREGPAGFSIPMIFRPTSQTFLEMAESY